MFMLHITAMDANSQGDARLQPERSGADAARPDPPGAAVLVTGTGKGIGEAITQRLAQLGMLVFAGVRKEADAARWRSSGAGLVHPVLLDVTDESSISAALQQIRFTLGARTLTGLVNNAGIAVAGPLEFLPVRELRRQLEVNVIGQLAVTQAVLPLLRQSRGRIVNIGSIAGRSALPLTGAYAASKFALEALTDALRVELLSAGIQVSIIEPGVIATPIWETSLRSADLLIREMPPQALDHYGRIIDAVRRRATGGIVRGLPPRVVADAVVHALTARKPKTRYLIGRDARVRAWFQRLPDRLRDRIITRQLAKL
jgi:NAD(P)-dependent dehydrogenase (short-subunit alcohol dehydrogenase family)